MNRVSTFLRDAAFRKQLNVTVTIGVMFFALASSMLTSWQGGRQVRQTLQEQGRQIAGTLARQSTLALVFSSPDNASEAIRTAMSFPDVTRVEIRHASGRPLVLSGQTDNGTTDAPLPTDDVREAYLEAETDATWRFVAPVLSKAGDSPFDLVERKEELLGFVRVEQSKATLTRVLAYIFIANLAISVVFAALFLYVLGRLAARLTRPITELSVVMARAETGETSVRASLGGPKDIRDMAKAFNSMIAALEERELALRESRASYREVFDSVNEVIFQTNARSEWVLLNPAWSKVTGIEVEAALGKPMSDVILDADRATVERWNSLMKLGVEKDCRFEVRFTRHDGSIGWLNVAQHVRHDEGGGFAGTSGILDDITERKRAAERLASLNVELESRVRLRTAELEASNRELEAFSYSVSHDLRAPLRAIDGFSRLIEEEYAEKLDDAGRGYFGRVRGATQRMSQLIDDLLNLARITRTAMNRQPVDLGALAAEILKELTDAEPDRRIEAEIVPAVEARVDPVLVRVVFDNLIGNAWKYSAKRDVARIAFGVETRQTADGVERVFFVRDNGAGFDMTYADKLFRPFSRLHGTNEFAGTGIGLATVQRVIYRHGGRIWADAAVDGGATFYFTLPDM